VTGATTAPVERTSLLHIDPLRFRERFDRQPFLVQHQLVGHPLFALPRLIELSRALPGELVEYNAGDVPVSLDPTWTPRTGLSIEETIRRIEECRSWMVFKNVERDPDYQALLDACLDQVREHSESAWPGMDRREGFIFVSSPGSVTPYHMDPEHNFLLQIRGQKQVSLFDGEDRALLTERELEKFYARGHRNLVFDDVNQRKAQVFTLAPGDGLYVPVTWPHWVKNGPEVSVSFSITFRTASSDRREVLYRVNERLRRVGIKLPPVGHSELIDGAKYQAFRTLARAHRLFAGRSETTVRSYQ